MIDAVLSYHTNPYTCGVAKFSHRLARELGVPFGQIGADRTRYQHPLVSVKFSELIDAGATNPNHFLKRFDLFVHDYEPGFASWLTDAERVYAANAIIAGDMVRLLRPDVIEAWCPSTVEGNPTRGTINVLTFGMAHKLQTKRYEKVKALLEATGQDYTVSVSTAVHEGSPWDETAKVSERLAQIFGHRLRTLGYLADDALARELSECSAVALFFEPALRANNTTYWAAIESGLPVITNRDVYSPPGGWDIDELSAWPPPETRANVRGLTRAYGWNALLEKMQVQPCVK